MSKITITNTFGRAIAKVFGRDYTGMDAERLAEKRVQDLIKNAPHNRDASKDRFIHKEVGRIPIFTIRKRRLTSSTW